MWYKLKSNKKNWVWKDSCSLAVPSWFTNHLLSHSQQCDFQSHNLNYFLMPDDLNHGLPTYGQQVTPSLWINFYNEVNFTCLQILSPKFSLKVLTKWPSDIWVCHGGDYEDCCFLGCDTMLSDKCVLKFQRNLPPSSSGWQQDPMKCQ